MRSNYKKQKVLKGRIGILLVVVGCIVGISILMGNKETFSHTDINYKTVYVSYGESLWEISKDESVNNLYYENQDIRHIINDIKAKNNLRTSSIYEGQELLIPFI